MTNPFYQGYYLNAGGTIATRGDYSYPGVATGGNIDESSGITAGGNVGDSRSGGDIPTAGAVTSGNPFLYGQDVIAGGNVGDSRSGGDIALGPSLGSSGDIIGGGTVGDSRSGGDIDAGSNIRAGGNAPSIVGGSYGSTNAPRSVQAILRLQILFSRALLPIFFAIPLLVFFIGLGKFIARLGKGNEEALEEGKRLIKWGIIAMFIVASIWGIVAALQNALITANPIYLETIER